MMHLSSNITFTNPPKVAKFLVTNLALSFFQFCFSLKKKSRGINVQQHFAISFSCLQRRRKKEKG
jgi:hypothetical protein